MLRAGGGGGVPAACPPTEGAPSSGFPLACPGACPARAWLLSKQVLSPCCRGERPGCGRDVAVVSSSLKILCALWLGHGCRQQRFPHGDRVRTDLLRGQLREEVELIFSFFPRSPANEDSYYGNSVFSGDSPLCSQLISRSWSPTKRPGATTARANLWCERTLCQPWASKTPQFAP